MKILDLLKDVSIDVNATCSNKDEAIDTLVSLMAKQGNLNDQDVYKQGIYAREELSTTGIGEGIAIPHAQSEAVNAPGLAAMVVKDGVDYQSLDNQPAKLFFMIAVPKTGGNEHLQILAMLSQMLMDTDFKDSLINAQSVEEFMDLINQKEAAQKAKEEEKEEAQKACRFRLSSSPTLPPMRKVSCVLPATASSSIRRLSSTLEQGFPSMHRAMTAPPLGSLSRMAAASAASARCTSAGEGDSGRRLSGSSTNSSLQKRWSRLTYSAAASR